MFDSNQFLRDSSREYAIYVCSTRAIPNVQDGLKHGQRIALWLLRNKAEKIKTVALSGIMAAERLYVHGDVSASNTIGLLAAPYKNNVPLIEGLGQFGSRVAPVEGIGAPRYTEVRRSKAADAFLYTDLELVPLKDNYDGSNQEPEFFLPLIPTVLLNGVEGVAVGWSTSILPRDLKGLIQATQDALEGKDTIRGLMPHYERYNIKVKQIGMNQYEFTGALTIEDTSNLRVTELPPGLSLENFRKRLIQMEEMEHIVTFTDRSTEVIDISIKFKRGELKGWTVDKALEYLKLKEKTTERIVVIDWDGNAIRTYLDPSQLVRDFVQWRLDWYTKRFERLRDIASHELIYWQILKALFDAGFTKKLGTFKDRKSMEEEIEAIAKKAKIAATDQHIDRVVGLPTYRWTVEFKAEVDTKIKSLLADIAEYSAILKSPDRRKKIYMDELDALLKIKFGK
jgi:DNA gyrase/topoisomerase IV subunit A